jgi:hypothetical protein
MRHGSTAMPPLLACTILPDTGAFHNCLWAMVVRWGAPSTRKRRSQWLATLSRPTGKGAGSPVGTSIVVHAPNNRWEHVHGSLVARKLERWHCVLLWPECDDHAEVLPDQDATRTARGARRRAVRVHSGRPCSFLRVVWSDHKGKRSTAWNAFSYPCSISHYNSHSGYPAQILVVPPWRLIS